MRHRDHIQIARRLRGQLSLPEVLLWVRLRPKAFPQSHVRRQHPVLNRYVLDFYCDQVKTAFEIDGYWTHVGREDEDARRHVEIESLGIRIVRIDASGVLRDPDGVAEWIKRICMGEDVDDD